MIKSRINLLQNHSECSLRRKLKHQTSLLFICYKTVFTGVSDTKPQKQKRQDRVSRQFPKTLLFIIATLCSTLSYELHIGAKWNWYHNNSSTRLTRLKAWTITQAHIGRIGIRKASSQNNVALKSVLPELDVNLDLKKFCWFLKMSKIL